MGKNLRVKGLSILIAIVMFITTFSPREFAGASSETNSKYITADEFINQLVQAVKLDTDPSSESTYLDAAKTAGILKDDDFTDYSENITRTDAAVLLNRADEYLHKDTVKKQLLDFVLKKRISDIDKIPEEKREDVAKVFAKGIMKGYFNGYYRQNRSFKGNEYLTESNAKSYITLVTNTSKRAKLSPDGELIRTTNLPKNAKSFEYILACYPNRFYEKKFEFMFFDNYLQRGRDPKSQILPVEMKKSTFKTWNDQWSFSIEMDKYLYEWQEKAETYLNYLFNVNYKTVDSKWINGLASCYAKSNINYVDHMKKYYIKYMKKNKVIIESSVIAVEPSTLYCDDISHCMRAYVRYRVFADDINVDHSRLIYSPNYPYFKDLKNGVWRTGIFDIRYSTNNGFQGDGAYWAISQLTNLNDSYIK